MEASLQERGRDRGPGIIQPCCDRRGWRVLNTEGLLDEDVEQAAPGRGDIRSIVKGRGDGVGRFQTHGELVAGAGVIGRGEERRVRRDAGDGGEAEIAFAARRGVREFLDGAAAALTAGQLTVSSLVTKTVPLMDLVFCRISASRSACASPSSPERYAGPKWKE